MTVALTPITILIDPKTGTPTRDGFLIFQAVLALNETGVTLDGTQTITNKTISGADNSISGLPISAVATETPNGAVATTVTSLGPTGSHTTIQEWLAFTNGSGTIRYIPVYREARMDPFSLAALFGAGASILSSFFGANAAQQAGQTQADAENRAVDLQAKTIAQARVDAAPWLQAGQKALGQYMGELGLSKTVQAPSTTDAAGVTTPGAVTPFKSQFAATPNYAFDVQQGTRGVINNLAALGLKGSGAAQKAIGSYITGKANDTYQQYLDRLSGVSTGGATTEGQTSALAGNSAAQQGQFLSNAGAATASGYVGAANALSSGITGAASNYASYLGQRPGTSTSWF